MLEMQTQMEMGLHVSANEKFFRCFLDSANEFFS